MALVLRVAYNDQGWRAPCRNLRGNSLHYQCEQGRVNVGFGEDVSGACKATCWEKDLCTKYEWHSILGNWGLRAAPGEKVYFVFRQRDGLYTIWGRSEIDRTNGKDIFFLPFSALPETSWVKNLKDTDLVGKRWLQGFYRYISNGLEAYVEGLLGGKPPTDTISLPSRPEPPAQIKRESGFTTKNISLKNQKVNELEKIAQEEGREVDDLIREAVGEWIRGRGASHTGRG
jgi:hypothetical protein